MTALVTGASSGIGLAYAHELASLGYDLVLVSNQEAEQKAVAAQIAKEYKVRTWARYADLSTAEAPQELYDFCRAEGLEIEVLVNNAGVFFFQYLKNVPMRRLELMLELHVLAVARMCRLFGEDMARRGHGYILNMSSLSAWMAMPGIQTYNASKSFINNFSKSIWYEMKRDGVHVLSVTPGAVDTGLYNLKPSLRRLAVSLRVSIPPEKLAHLAIDKLLHSWRKTYCPGFFNRIFRPTIEHLPDWFVFLALKKIDRFVK